jgi:hypothetical protein
MAGGWNGSPMGADDVDQILRDLSGDDSSALPRGFAGMTVTSIATGATTNCTVPLNAFLRIKRPLLGAAACVDLSYVQDIKVGTISLNVGTQPIPCVAFARDAVGTYIDAAVWASPSVAPVIVIYNNSGGTIVYAGGIFGDVSLQRPAGAVAA